ncbi:hypothetical protein GSI_14772 [Ganoderma sinense ZZ0214-1]|uniref:Peptidase C14 caspase domain-containing protein n=1 Tax=Ganoderma sinense ZZ0214-1 TaxID=1077348 RepID=A0A2G8RPP2_9APHY|nr:hypothetical protein GSI_14772 [Ganoderma sinense ZZ0214-1]
MSDRTPVKKAVLVGIRSKPSADFDDVPGAHKDVKKLWELLTQTYQYEPSDITILVDLGPRQRNPDLLPTKENMLRAMRELVADKVAGDRIVFSFSGHGDQAAPTNDKNETDGKDEVLMTANTGGPCTGYSHFIRDDDIREIFVDQLQEGVQCTLIFDCCHSGTACDLPEVDDSGPASAPGFSSEETLNHEHAASAQNGDLDTAAGSQATDFASRKEVASWSACSDDQLTYGSRKGGCFTDAFVDILGGLNGNTIQYQDLLLGLRDRLEAVIDNVNERDAPSPPYEVPTPQLGSLRANCILGEDFTL